MVPRRFLPLIGCGAVLALSVPVLAQQPASLPLADVQKEGRRIFQQRCAVCHTPPTVVSKRYGPPLYKDIVEDNVPSRRAI